MKCRPDGQFWNTSNHLKHICSCALLAALLPLAACTGLQPPRAESPHVYLLDAQPAISAAQTKRDLVLAVSMPQARSGFDTPRMAYVREPHELEYFAAHQWADTPTHMIAPLLVQALEQNGSFRAVVRYPSAVAADIRLDTELIRLQQDFSTRPSRVKLTLRAQLIDMRSKQVLATRQFEETEDAPGDNPNSGVAAGNRALQRVLEQVAGFCVSESARP